MKGHSIPGIKGFKGTTLEDGRAASSAFQMQSPLNKFKADGDEVNVGTDPKAPKLDGGDNTETESTETTEGTEIEKKSKLGGDTKMDTDLDQSK